MDLAPQSQPPSVAFMLVLCHEAGHGGSGGSAKTVLMTGKRGRKRKYKGAGAQTSKMGKGWMWQEQKYTIEGDKVFLLSNSWEKYSKEIELWG